MSTEIVLSLGKSLEAERNCLTHLTSLQAHTEFVILLNCFVHYTVVPAPEGERKDQQQKLLLSHINNTFEKKKKRQCTHGGENSHP